MLSVIIHILLLLAIIHICSGAFKYIPISILHHYFIPIYALVIFLLRMKWQEDDLLFLAFLLPVGILIGWYETRKLQVEKRWNLKKEKYGYYVRRNWPYVIGWIVTVVLGVAISALAQHGSFSQLFTKKIFDTLFEEFDPFLIFTSSRPWYLWLLTGSSSIAFTLFARRIISRLEHSSTIKVVTKEEVLEKEKEKEEKKAAGRKQAG